MSYNAKRLIAINTIRKIIDIFLGPFLTAYFFKISTDSITIISLYNIFSYAVIAAASFIVGIIIKNRYEIETFRLGMIIKFIQLIVLVILGKNVIKYVWLVAFISGIATITWAFPLNLFSSTLVDNKEKKEFIVYKTMFMNIAKVAIPIVFGTIITAKSFEKTAIIVLMLSLSQIILSFRLDYKKEKNIELHKFKLLETYKKLKANNNTKKLLKIVFLQGMTYEGALDTTITLLIIMAFSKEFTLGLITSVTSILSILSAYVCKKITGKKSIRITILISGIIPLISTALLILLTNKYTIVNYNMIYAVFITIIAIMIDVKTLKLANSKIINDSNRVEAYVLLEMFLGLGRIISYILLIIVGMLKELYLLKILIIILTSCILLIGRNLNKIEID